MNRFGQRITRPGEDFRVADRLEIMDLIWRYAAAIDLGDLDMFEECFAERLRLDLSRNPVRWTGSPADDGECEFERSEFMEIIRGRDASKIQRPTTGRKPVKNFTHHGILNPIITFTGVDDATGLGYNHERLHYWFVDTPGEEEVEWVDMGGWYHLNFTRTSDRWRISALRLEIQYFDPGVLYQVISPRLGRETQ